MLKLIPESFALALREHPEYRREWLPETIPEGFTDSSWRNDVSPSIGRDYGDFLRLRVWFEMPDSAAREWEGSGRYIVTLEHMAAGVDCETVLESESWGEVLQWFDVSDFDSVVATPIVSHGGLFRFIRCLISHRAMFHFEDSPESIIWGEPCPVTPEHFPALAARVAEAYALKGWHRDRCPIGVALDMGATEEEIIDGSVCPAPAPQTPPSVTLESLAARYAEWVESNGLPKLTADELTCELASRVDVIRDQQKWLGHFMTEWGIAETRQTLAAKLGI